MGTPSWLSRLMQAPKVAGGPSVLPSGLRSWRTTLGGAHARVHLRAEPDGTALALLNASSAVRLTASGAAMVTMVLDGEEDGPIIKALRRSFDAPRDRLARDLADLRDTLARLAAAPGGSFPIEDLTDGRGTRTSALSAPLEAWVEMAPLDALIPRIDALWDAAVPHITLLATSSTSADDLVRAVERAEDLGMICGIRGLGSALTPDTIKRCAEAGVDCVQIPLLANTDEAHDQILGAGERQAAIAALVACAEHEVCPIAEVPLIDATAANLADLADAARSCEAETLALWALVEPEGEDTSGALAAQALLQLGEEAEEISESGRAHVLWAPPVHADGRALGVQIEEGPRSAGDAAIRVTADGSVLPARGAASAGILGTTAWEAIWQHAAFRTLREELAIDHRCARCPDLALCSTECPLDASMWARRES